MAKKSVLKTDVHVTNDKGEAKLLKAGSEVPKWASKLVTNPKAFTDVEDASEESTTEAGSGQQPPAGADGSGQQPPAYVAKRPNGDDIAPYADWAYHDLQAEAGSKGRALTGGGAGSQEELIARLVADDAAQAE